MAGREASAGRAPVPSDEARPYGYGLQRNIVRYRRGTAKPGKHYTLRTMYVPLFLDSLFAALGDSRPEAVPTIGCGGGMATLCLADELRQRGVEVELMVGADLVPNMIAAARQDLADYGSEWARERLRFVVAPHERLMNDLPTGLGVGPEDLAGSFHFALESLRSGTRCKKAPPRRLLRSSIGCSRRAAAS